MVFLIGDAAVGKMTVGQELMKQTGLRLFHNHMMIEPVIEIFGAFNGHVTQQLREVIFREFAKSDNEGMIITYLWAFDMQSDWDYVAHVADIFREQGEKSIMRSLSHRRRFVCSEMKRPIVWHTRHPRGMLLNPESECCGMMRDTAVKACRAKLPLRTILKSITPT